MFLKTFKRCATNKFVFHHGSLFMFFLAGACGLHWLWMLSCLLSFWYVINLVVICTRKLELLFKEIFTWKSFSIRKDCVTDSDFCVEMHLLAYRFEFLGL